MYLLKVSSMPPKKPTNNTQGPLLSASDPEPYTLIEADSPLILAGPHNAYYVPESLYMGNRPLGVHRSAFKPLSPFKRHEACDWGMQGLFAALQGGEVTATNKCNYLSSNYSRLVTDLNRAPEDSMSQQSEETGNIVAGNTLLTKAQKQERIDQVFMPYHNALKDLIKAKKEKFGYVLFLDLHSFTPVWRHKVRKVQIGSLAFDNNPLEPIVAEELRALCKDKKLKFVSHAPYRMDDYPPHKQYSSIQIEKYGALYTGLEVRNDLLRTPKKAKDIAKILEALIQSLLDQKDKSLFDPTYAE